MENPEGVLNLLDEFAKLKSKEIPSDLEEYLSYVASSGDPVYQWSLIKSLYRQKLINVVTEFYEMCPVVEIPRCPNVDPFNYETMKNGLLKRLDSFSSAPFTIQRISELLTNPRKQYNRVDKFMRAIEKNIWVVSTREPGPRETSSNPQETSASLVNGVTPRVRVTVKHPKRVKSIEERIKSGHPQLIDDEEEEEEEEEGEEMDEYEPMEEETSTEILPNNEADDSSLQCTSVKDLIEKYENGTIFSNAEEKTDFEEKSGQLEDAAAATAAAAAAVVADMITTTAAAVSADVSSIVGGSSSSSTAASTGTITTARAEVASSDEVLHPSQQPSESVSEVSDLEQIKEPTPIYKEIEEMTPDSVGSESEQKAVSDVSNPRPDSSQRTESAAAAAAQEQEKSDVVSAFDSEAEVLLKGAESSSSSSPSPSSAICSDPVESENSSLEMMVEPPADSSISNNACDEESDFHSARETPSNLSESSVKIDSVDKSEESL